MLLVGLIDTVRPQSTGVRVRRMEVQAAGPPACPEHSLATAADCARIGNALTAALQAASAPSNGESLLQQLTVSVVRQAIELPAARVRATLHDPLRDVREGLQQLVQDLVLTRAQQEVLQRVMSCNTRFWDISINGCNEGTPPWQRHVSLNMALLRIYHCRVAAQTCSTAISASLTAAPPLKREVAEDAVWYCRWMVASYCCRTGALPPGMSETDLIARAAEIAGVEPATIVDSELCDIKQTQDPLCPRFLVAVDSTRNEVVIAIRGTASLSDMFADLIGDTVPFAGGVAHGGISDAARRLRVRLEESLRAAVSRLRVNNNSEEAGHCPQKPRLVLTGHSLGAGVAGLLGILLRGGDGNTAAGSTSWCLPAEIELATYLYAPPPVYSPRATHASQSGAVSTADEDAAAAAQSAVNCAIGFAMNYDIIPRTSLHNGYKLFQQARVVDMYVRWKKTDIVSLIREAAGSGERAEQARTCITEAVQGAINEAAVSGPASTNPFPLQHPAVAEMFPIVGAPGGTAAFVPVSATGALAASSAEPMRSRAEGLPRDDVGDVGDAAVPLGRSPALRQEAEREAKPLLSGPAPVLPRDDGGWLWKRSLRLREWRRRYAWIADGELHFAHSETGPEPKVGLPLTAGATSVMLHGRGSTEAFPAALVAMACDGGNEDGSQVAEHIAGQPREVGDQQTRCFLPWIHKLWMNPPSPWVFKVSTAAVGGVCPTTAAEVMLCAESAASRDAWVRRIVDDIRAARHRCYRVQPPVPPEVFGMEALLADGFLDDHQVLRYEAALETALEMLEHPP